MHQAVFHIAMVWLIGLLVSLAVFALRTRSAVPRILALDVLAIVFSTALALIGIQRGEAGYFDVALIMAMLGFVQTVAAARYTENHQPHSGPDLPPGEDADAR